MKSASQQVAGDHVEEGTGTTARPLTWIAQALRRSWWIAFLVVIVVGGFSYARFTREPSTYFTSQTLYIDVTPAGASSSYDNYQAAVWAETIGHALSEGRLTTVIGGFAGAINTQLSGYRPTSNTDPQGLSSSQFQQHLSWTNYGNQVVLTAFWSSPGGAAKLLSATVAALVQGNLTNVTIWRGALPANLVAHVVSSGVPTAPKLDQQQRQAEFVSLVLARMVLSVPAGILLIFAWEWLRQRSSGK